MGNRWFDLPRVWVIICILTLVFTIEKDWIDAQKKIVDDLGEAIRNGFEEKDILCEKFFDYDQGKVLWRSKQNGNVVKIEDMKPADYQLDFTYEKKEIEEKEDEKENSRTE